MRASRLLVPCLLALAACDRAATGANEPVAPATLAVASSVPSLALVRGQPADPVTITVTRQGGANVPVALSASGAPAGVSVSFAPATLTGAQATSAMNVRVAGTTTASEGTLVVTASTPTLQATARVALTIRNP